MNRRRRASGGREPRSIGDSLKAVTAGFGSRGRAIDLNERWTEAVGEAIAAHAHPERLEAGRLTVVVDDPAWATELRYHSSRILAALNADSAAATVSELHLRVHPGTGQKKRL
ncbi:DciA family protein [Candidatus Poriferisodalis sp.]|uniref:DciA family protein n=1 Tax=Candidatus Poriferisodalis sp. TaxID=3101277 RepID=UPI003B0286F6